MKEIQWAREIEKECDREGTREERHSQWQNGRQSWSIRADEKWQLQKTLLFISTQGYCVFFSRGCLLPFHVATIDIQGSNFETFQMFVDGEFIYNYVPLFLIKITGRISGCNCVFHILINVIRGLCKWFDMSLFQWPLDELD